MGMWEHGGEVFPHEQQRVAGRAWSKVGSGQGTAQWGLMVGSVFESLLRDLLLEGWAEEAAELQQAMERRVHGWLSMPFPYGSEFAWDNTGHEEIATWLLAYGYDAKAAQTADAVSAYTSLSPHWAYCGSARRWWDFVINGDARPKYNGNERVLHHYAGALKSPLRHTLAPRLVTPLSRIISGALNSVIHTSHPHHLRGSQLGHSHLGHSHLSPASPQGLSTRSCCSQPEV